MKTRLFAALGAALLTCSGTIWAQDAESPNPTWIPVETYACNFNEGKTMADLAPVIDEWNAWMDDEGVTDYFASLVTPSYYGERKMDVGWLGAWSSGNAMGSLTDMWVTEGGELGAKFAAVLDCGAHTNYASTIMKPPTGEPEEGDTRIVLTFANCTVRDGQDFDGVMAGMGAWVEYQVENGFQNASYMMFPIYGEANDDYSFKMVNAHDDHAALGADWELFGNGGHWVAEQEMLANLFSCDSPRVYDARVLRDMEMEED